MGRKVLNASPYYTPAKPIRGQEQIPIGTVHTCTGCNSDYVCDVQDCQIDRVTLAVECPACAPDFTQHSRDPRNIRCKHCSEYGCKKKHRVCRSCGGVDGNHYRCSTQPGYQFRMDL